ncbi:uncharacterized protein N7515_008636 [Penicillium bovifimosum]|uniref:FAS1 domain-containing protein n=1 Tax=Penicillium bovifimosum TaxID=126998 RepID=A0A9W9KXX1_9EURO|nr:uncharacterized protein N7515_008636 [Penicillium bovifimosum]KAJ5124811.1 hypothetical protein N7515_008636 [Penicillium bovifimosum]
MKTFTFCAALLASTALALPAGTSTSLPTGVPTAVASVLPTTAVPLPTGTTKSHDPLHKNLAVTDSKGLLKDVPLLGGGDGDILVALTDVLYSIVGRLDLSHLFDPIGDIIALAPDLSAVKSQIPSTPGANFIALNTGDEKNSVALVKVNSAVKDLFSVAGLDRLGTSAGSLIKGEKAK